MNRAEELRALAQRIADTLPVDEVVLTGGVSRGVADEWSDLELLCLVPALPPLEQAETQARVAGVEPTTRFGSAEITYVAGAHEGTTVELVWVEPATFDGFIDRAFAGELLDHSRLRGLEALEHGVALRGGERLAAWQRRLAEYPDRLREQLILDAIDDWGGYPVAAYLRQAHRDDRYSLVRVVLEVTDDVLRLLFALNRRWERSWKRLPDLLAGLEVAPPDAAERIASALTTPEAREALRVTFELARDAVALVGPEIETDRARAWLDEAVAELQ